MTLRKRRKRKVTRQFQIVLTKQFQNETVKLKDLKEKKKANRKLTDQDLKETHQKKVMRT